METLAPSSYRPWPDLPDPLLEIILERLPLSAYVRFPAVCRRWRSVQSSHRRRHYPYPPPMIRLPWLITPQPHLNTLSCYSPFEDRFFSIPLPFYLQPFLAQGWFLSSDSTLENPISGSTIQLPPVDASLLAPITISPPPNYIVSIISPSGVLLLRWFDPTWINLNLPSQVKSLLPIGGKHYGISPSQSHSFDLLVVDALAAPPSIQHFEMMGWSELPKGSGRGRRRGTCYLAEFGGKPLLVEEILDSYRGGIVGFQVFRADLGRRMWVGVDSIGDTVLVLHDGLFVSLLAADIGARGNCVYFTADIGARGNCVSFSTGLGLGSREDRGEAPWKVFDLGTGRVTALMLPNASMVDKYHQQLFVPTLS